MHQSRQNFRAILSFVVCSSVLVWTITFAFLLTLHTMSRGRNRRILSSPGKVDNSERRRMSSFLIRTGCKTVLAVIFGLAALRFFDGVYSEQHTTKTTSQHTTKRQIGIRRMRGPSECTNIQYKLQEEGKFNGADFLRYAAFCGDEPISIHQWAEIMASSNASVTRSLTNLLQVS
jgi:hypothetical protein